MISFRRLGKIEFGRMGNQLFQYAFLRTQANRLGVKFFCPHWIGDEIFILNDKNQRGNVGVVNKTYCEKSGDKSYDSSVLDISDNTDIQGYFQSEKYFDKNSIAKWFFLTGPK